MALQSTTGDKHWKPNASMSYLARDKIAAGGAQGSRDLTAGRPKASLGGHTTASSKISKFRVKHAWNGKTWQQS